ncbi:YheC/YheD family protein [Robertmurraya korlensis]|uniref:YheC/YheD family endospore coat-associated protein n=1 Tax=Robertmurraya korlensis TaxID=519977 RepID=UPI00203A441D|nr:YheC/YheD family protein [Robertmurraya korlensis]MCM3602714.1 YheC/YheD family protein [Robertmurraya korlensis]
MIKVRYTFSEVDGKRNSNLSEGELPPIHLSKGFLQQHQIHSNVTMIKFGNWLQEFSVVQNNMLSDNEIGFMRNNESFLIPENISFDIIVKNNVIHLGPFIAFIVKKSFAQLSQNTLEHYRKLYYLYEKNPRFVLICSSDKVDTVNQTITGFYFTQGKWVKGIFPYPDSIFKKTRMPFEKELELRKATGEKLFNTSFISKLDFWNACSKDAEVKKYLPETKRFQTVHDLDNMLTRYQTVYLKPAKGMQGNGIFVIQKEPDGIYLINNMRDKKKFTSLNELIHALEKMLPKQVYILQQGVPTIYKNKKYDFRLYFQKDYTKKWICQGSVGRVAQEGSIITNLKQVAHIANGEKTIQIIYKVNESKAKRIMIETIEVCKKVCEMIDQELGHFGDIALDLIIDHHYKPWVLEVNTLYGKKSLKITKDEDLKIKLHTTPFEYAAALAGF